MKKNLNHTLLKGMILLLVGIACVALLQATSKAEEDDDWLWGGPHPPISDKRMGNRRGRYHDRSQRRRVAGFFGR
ncbi:MAG: hypothetical protein R2912_00340 [Eubacteriales bacterium]